MSEQKQPDKKGSPPTSSNHVFMFEKERKAGETYQVKMKTAAEYKALSALSSPSSSPEPSDPSSSKPEINIKLPEFEFQDLSAFAGLSPELAAEQYLLAALSSLNNGKSFEENYIQFHAFIKKLKLTSDVQKIVKNEEESEEEIEELDEEGSDEESEEENVEDAPLEIKGQKPVPQNSPIINEILEELDSKIEFLEKKAQKHLSAYQLEQALEDLCLLRELLNLKNKLDKDNNAKTLIKLEEVSFQITEITECRSVLMMSPRLDGERSAFVSNPLPVIETKGIAEQKINAGIRKIDPVIEEYIHIKRNRPQYWAEFEKYNGSKLLSAEDEIAFQELENQEFDDVESIYKKYVVNTSDLEQQENEAAEELSQSESIIIASDLESQENEEADDASDADNASEENPELTKLKALCPKEIKAEQIARQTLINYHGLLKLTLNLLDQKRKFLEVKPPYKQQYNSALKEIFDLLKEASDYLRLFGELQNKINPNDKAFKSEEDFKKFCAKSKQFFHELQTFFYLRAGYIFSETGNYNIARIFYEQAAVVKGSKDYEVVTEEWTQIVAAINETDQYHQFFSQLKILESQKILIGFYISIGNFDAVEATLLQSKQIIEELRKFKGKEKFIDETSGFAFVKTKLTFLDEKIQSFLPPYLHGLLGATNINQILIETPSEILKQGLHDLNVTEDVFGFSYLNIVKEEKNPESIQKNPDSQSDKQDNVAPIQTAVISTSTISELPPESAPIVQSGSSSSSKVQNLDQKAAANSAEKVGYNVETKTSARLETKNTQKSPALILYDPIKRDPYINYLRKILIPEVSKDDEVSESAVIRECITKTELKKIAEPLLKQVQQCYFELNFEQGILLLWRYVEITKLRLEVYQEDVVPQIVHGYFLLKLFYNKLNWGFELSESLKRHLSVNDGQRTILTIENTPKVVNSKKYLELIIEPAYKNSIVLGSTSALHHYCFDYFNLLKNVLGNVNSGNLFYLYTRVFADNPNEVLKFDFLALIQRQIRKGDYRDAAESLKDIALELLQFLENEKVSKVVIVDKLKEIYKNLKYCYESLKEPKLLKELYLEEFDIYKSGLNTVIKSFKVKNDGRDLGDKQRQKNALNKFKHRFCGFLEYTACFIDDSEYVKKAEYIFKQFIAIEEIFEKDPEMVSVYENELQKDSQKTFAKMQEFLSLIAAQKPEQKEVDKNQLALLKDSVKPKQTLSEIDAPAASHAAQKPEQKEVDKNQLSLLEDSEKSKQTDSEIEAVTASLNEIYKKMRALDKKLEFAIVNNTLSIRDETWLYYLGRINNLNQKSCEIENSLKKLECSKDVIEVQTKRLAQIKERLSYFLSRIFLLHKNFQLANILLEQNLKFLAGTGKDEESIKEHQKQVSEEQAKFKTMLEKVQFQQEYTNLFKKLELQYQLIKFSGNEKVIKDRLVADCLQTLDEINKKYSENNNADFTETADGLLKVLDGLNKLDPRFLKISKGFDKFIKEKDTQRRWQRNFARWEIFKLRNTSSFFQRNEDKILTTAAVISPFVIYGVVDYCLNQNFAGLSNLMDQNYLHPDLEAYMAYAFFAVVLIALILAIRSDRQYMGTLNPICYLNEPETGFNEKIDNEQNVEDSREQSVSGLP